MSGANDLERPGPMRDLAGRSAIVTGGASGIGLATVRLLGARGVRVLVVDLDEDGARRAAEEVGGWSIRADVSRSSEWAKVVTVAKELLGGLDLAHLNAGVTTGEAELAMVSDEAYRRIMGVNVDGVVFGIRALVPVMSAGGGGAIVVTASLAGLVAFGGDPIYTLTKHALIGLVRSLPPQLSPMGISVNALCPGLVNTPLLDGPSRELLEGSGFPLIAPEEVAAAVVACMAGGQTGQAVVVQAGIEPTAYRFSRAPGPRTDGGSPGLPPGPLLAHDQVPPTP